MVIKKGVVYINILKTIIVVLAIMISGCTEVSNLKSNFANTVDNYSTKDKKITKLFSIKELERLPTKNITIEEIENGLDIELLRKNGEYFYSVHKSNKGGYLYILYKFKNNDKQLWVTGWTYLESDLKKEDFNSVIVGKTKSKEIRKIDPNMSILALGIGNISVHKLSDGGIIRIEYILRNGLFVVSKISYEKKDSDSVLKYIKPEDLPDRN